MQYRVFKDGIRLSRLGMGVMRLPVVDGDDSRIDFEKAKKLIDKCMTQGINYYDTAYIYHGGKSEEFLGKALADYPRDSFYVTDKYNFQAEPDYRKQFPEQLRRMQMDRFDFSLLHWIQDEFADEIDGWVIDALKNIGCYTAKSVLAKEREEIMERADLEEQTVDDVFAILSAEFEDDENE